MWILGAVGKGWAEANEKKLADAKGIAGKFATQLKQNPNWTVEDMKLARNALAGGNSSLLELLPSDQRLGEIATRNKEEYDFKKTGDVINRRQTLQEELDRRYNEYMDTSSTGNPEKDYEALVEIRNSYVNESGIDQANTVWKGLRSLGSPATGDAGTLFRFAKNIGEEKVTGRRAAARSEWRNILEGMKDEKGIVDIANWESARQKFKSTWGERLGGDSVWNTFFQSRQQLENINKQIKEDRVASDQDRAYTLSERNRKQAELENNTWLKNLQTYKDVDTAAKITAEMLNYEGDAATELQARLKQQNTAPILSEIANNALTKNWHTIKDMIISANGEIDEKILANQLGFKNEELVSMVKKFAKQRYDDEQSESLSEQKRALEGLVKDSTSWAYFNSATIPPEEKLAEYKRLAELANLPNASAIKPSDMWSHLNAVQKGVFAKGRQSYTTDYTGEYSTQRTAIEKELDSDEYKSQITAHLSLDDEAFDQRFKDDEPYRAAVQRAILQLFASGGVYHFDLATGSNRYIQALVDYAASNKEAIVGKGESVNTMAVTNHLQSAASGVFQNAALEMQRVTGAAPPLPKTQSAYVSSESNRRAISIIGPEYIDSGTFEDDTDLMLQQTSSAVQALSTKATSLANMGEEFTVAMDATHRKPLARELLTTRTQLQQLAQQIQTYVSAPHRYGGKLEDDRTVQLRKYLKEINEGLAEIEKIAEIIRGATPHEVQPGSDSTVTDPDNNNTRTRRYRAPTQVITGS